MFCRVAKKMGTHTVSRIARKVRARALHLQGLVASLVVSCGAYQGFWLKTCETALFLNETALFLNETVLFLKETVLLLK